ncbi:unnamed protein product [Leptidea sinapis]|uniref:Uncharacterized protein n=1 Tax=Leptidea sinapis TaxID=189913 RepID=A0A5E4Q6I6_9NEOP|nr:unnamed protein product [Leptidea sinapis]
MFILEIFISLNCLSIIFIFCQRRRRVVYIFENGIVACAVTDACYLSNRSCCVAGGAIRDNVLLLAICR